MLARSASSCSARPPTLIVASQKAPAHSGSARSCRTQFGSSALDRRQYIDLRANCPPTKLIDRRSWFRCPSGRVRQRLLFHGRDHSAKRDRGVRSVRERQRRVLSSQPHRRWRRLARMHSSPLRWGKRPNAWRQVRGVQLQEHPARHVTRESRSADLHAVSRRTSANDREEARLRG